MQHWMKKIFVVLITILTLGAYVPPIYLDANADTETDEVAPASSNDVAPESAIEEKHDDSNDAPESEDDMVRAITDQAKAQTFAKLGPRIVNQVEDEFMTKILPSIEEVVNQVLVEAGEESLPYYGITEKPSSGYGEKIFDIYDARTNKDIVRFHVRRDNRPQEGYWFNFHYHLSNDGFEKHHQIGEVYWDKNTPPKWMA
ncbi:YpjP family protein [Radiobacillus sp. PE A8.2]|uniref:YpjP family protein n=1 Tax=Radiobacillus sp. PE A8.2 TaxID=3380349 RepID=UPI00388DB7C9